MSSAARDGEQTGFAELKCVKRTFAGHTVEIRRAEFGSGAAEIAKAHIAGVDHDHVERLGGGCGWYGGRGCEEIPAGQHRLS